MKLTITTYTSPESPKVSEHIVGDCSAESILRAIVAAMPRFPWGRHLAIIEGRPTDSHGTDLLEKFAALVECMIGSDDEQYPTLDADEWWLEEWACPSEDGGRLPSARWKHVPRGSMLETWPGASVGEGVAHAIAHYRGAHSMYMFAILEDGVMVSLGTEDGISDGAQGLLPGAGGFLHFGSWTNDVTYGVSAPHGNLWIESLTSTYNGAVGYDLFLYDRLHIALLPEGDGPAGLSRRLLRSLASQPLSQIGFGEAFGGEETRISYVERRAARLIEVGAYEPVNDLVPDDSTELVCVGECGRVQRHFDHGYSTAHSSLTVSLPEPHPSPVDVRVPARLDIAALRLSSEQHGPKGDPAWVPWMCQEGYASRRYGSALRGEGCLYYRPAEDTQQSTQPPRRRRWSRIWR